VSNTTDVIGSLWCGFRILHIYPKYRFLKTDKPYLLPPGVGDAKEHDSHLLKQTQISTTTFSNLRAF
jgi:hypothetical protein